MRILIIDNSSGDPDEGQKIVAKKIGGYLGRNFSVQQVNARQVFRSFRGCRQLISFAPDIIHIFLRVNFNVLLMQMVLSLFFPRTKIVISLLQPPVDSLFSRIFMHIYKPSLALALSKVTQEKTAGYGWPVKLFNLGGVDTVKFSPIYRNYTKRRELRLKYNLDLEKPVLLHVGHLNDGRNLELLAQLTEETDSQALIVISTTFKPDIKIMRDLERKGCKIVMEYISNIEELYQMSDLYVFPTHSSDKVIEMPLSVLEAMSTNLPVLTTEVGNLKNQFVSGDGFYFCDTFSDFKSNCEKVLEGSVHVATRQMVLSFDWKNIGKELETVYIELLGGK